ncbi:hypothetical protein SV7mr_35620 [Stieleria bergensis]|uniref:Uncharacterized protein n=1 Tax=Stieleria bergensis TaxID=2528025 RepID=A0A517SY59_9BACT|nr:MAG: hypothetical protein CBB71_06815 [Rhodopirellula sp. TMED11]QDT61032.1 hypothetical protein SV7mr_35620 [Planctomycetes bacterium SV_7m_r]
MKPAILWRQRASFTLKGFTFGLIESIQSTFSLFFAKPSKSTRLSTDTVFWEGFITSCVVCTGLNLEGGLPIEPLLVGGFEMSKFVWRSDLLQQWPNGSQA